jgi:N6-adenosine-specific RNA methylase IME4
MTDLTTVNHQLPSTIEDLARFVLIGRDRMAAVRAEISAINRLGLAQEVRQQKLAEAQQISEVVLDAEVKLGQLIAVLPDGRGGDRGNQYTGGKSNNGVTSAKTKEQALKEIGFDNKMQANRLETLAKHPEIVAQAKAEAREQDDIVSRSFVLEKIKAKERLDKQNQVAEAVTDRHIPTGTYEVIYADPPWRYDFSETKTRDIENQYPTMSLDEIKGLEIPSADNAVLLLWATAPKLPEAFEVMGAWGFEYKTCAVWDKEKIGMGYWFRGQHELLLVGTKGQYSPPPPGARFPSVYRESRGEHSAKPERYYEMIETMFPGRAYLELFARAKHSERWEVWGNQL